MSPPTPVRVRPLGQATTVLFDKDVFALVDRWSSMLGTAAVDKLVEANVPAKVATMIEHARRPLRHDADDLLPLLI
jgi:hypothetical protein